MSAVQSRRNGEVLVIDTPERIFIGEVTAELKTLIENEYRIGSKRVIFNMSLTNNMGADGIGLIVSSHVTAEIRGGKFLLCHLHKRVRSLLEDTRIIGRLNIHQSEEAALAQCS